MSYFENIRNQANEQFLGADGFSDADGDFADYKSFSSQEQLNIDGPAMQAQESQPYIINIVVGTANVSNLEILDANTRQLAATTSGVTFTYGLPNITYAQFLATIANGNPFEIGKVRLVASNASTSVAQTQVLETVTILTKDLNGNEAKRSIIPAIDNYQYTSTQVDLNVAFLVNGLTSFVFGTVYANTTLKVFMYPSKKVNPFKAIESGANVTAYKAPNVNPILKK